MRLILAAAGLALACAAPAAAEPDYAARVEATLSAHVLPGFAALTAATAALSDAAAARCAGDGGDAEVRAAFHGAFDAWMGVSHLRFGPLEADSRGAAIAFWPDARGATPRALKRLIAEADPIVDDPAGYGEVSVAARGLMALDWLLYDADAPALEPGGYPCRLATAIAADLATVAAAAEVDWRGDYAARMRAADGPLYRSAQEAAGELAKAFAAGLQATAELRVGRPLGGERGPRPRLAEAWRSDRPMRNVALSLAAIEEMAATLFLPLLDADAAEQADRRFAAARAAAEAVPTPLAAALDTEEGRTALRRLGQQLALLRAFHDLTLAPAMGAGLGFNAMDGD
ncbi:imelysin family protein [Rubrimonas cliftonensis]|uniref:Imelysin-like domain-containing protein n=1 Tax=Rubrimonas cliftonensis TaxID=89524 RepID=A0A1H4EZH5_9RHOB|nr:imelysin family protein [Rubrimonas cliftonensis]SEA90465.1 hypothetical protein SAMN05444370_11727 [Rubrimonas cliftonensis]